MNLSVCAQDWIPLTKVENNGSGHYIVKGLTGIIISHISKKFNFSYRVVRPPDGWWGMKVNGSWNGMIGQIIRDECQLALGPFEITEDRNKVVRYSKSVHTDVITFMTAINYYESKSLEVLSHFKLIESQIWIYCIFSLTLVALISYIFQIFGQKLENSYDLILTKLLFSKPFIRFPLNSSTFSILIFVISITFFWINLNSLIGAQIVTLRPYNLIDSFEDLADNEHVIPLVFGNSAHYSNLNKTKNPAMLKLFNRIHDNLNESLIVGMPFDNESYRNGFMSGRYALMNLIISTLPFKAVLCTYNPYILIHVAKKVENQKPLALSFSRNRTDKQYLDLISKTNDWIDLCHTSGLMFKWIRDEVNEFIKTNDSQIRTCVLKSFDETISTNIDESVVLKLSAMKLFLKITFSLTLFSLSIILIEMFVMPFWFELVNLNA